MIKEQLVLVIKVKKVKMDHKVEVHQLVRLLLGQAVQVLYLQVIFYVMVLQLVELRTQLYLLSSEPLMVVEMDQLRSTFQI